MPPSPNAEEIFQLILRLEDELEEEGQDPDQRAFHLPNRAMHELGYESFALIEGTQANALFEQIREIHSSFYRQKDIAAGGAHAGAFMFRGISTLIEIPIIFGRVGIDLIQLCDLTDNQKIWLAHRKHDLDGYYETALNLLDFAGGFFRMGDFKPLPKQSSPLFFLARSHLQAAAATLCATLDTRGCVQSAILGSELSLKAAIAGHGTSDKELRAFGHDQRKLVAAVSSAYPNADTDGLLEGVRQLPPFVENRYSMDQPNRREAGRIVMTAQFIAAEAMRSVGQSTFRSKPSTP